MSRSLRFGLVALLLLAVAPLWADDDKKTDTLAGKWKVTKMEVNGQPADMGEAYLRCKDGKYSVLVGEMEVETGDYKIDTAKKPATLDFDIKSGNDKGKKQPGLFKMDGDKLIVALALPGGEKRPEKIEAGEDVVYVEMKKVKE